MDLEALQYVIDSTGTQIPNNEIALGFRGNMEKERPSLETGNVWNGWRDGLPNCAERPSELLPRPPSYGYFGPRHSFVHSVLVVLC